MRTNDEATRGYYLVKQTTEPYPVQEYKVTKGVDPQQTDFFGDIIRDAVFWNQVPNTTNWYTIISKRRGFI